MTCQWPIGDLDLAGVERFASAFASVLMQGDTVALCGELGAGKTTFARALVTCISREAIEIPSPTFALAQCYGTPRFPVTHVDCYRLKDADEAEELGLEEALLDGVLLVEWPERIANRLPADRLELLLEDTGADDTRRLIATGRGSWAARLERLKAALSFLERVGWSDAYLAWLQGDASTRSYARLRQGENRAVLMNAPPMPDGPAIRDGKSYSAIARLAEDVRAFVAVGNALHGAGLSVPEILAHDLEHGFLVLEDLGDRDFAGEIAAGGDEAALYTAAVEALVSLRAAPAPEALPLPGSGAHALPPYDRDALGIETELLLDWFWPALHGTKPSPDIREAFLGAWEPLFAFLEDEPPTWVLRDYHSPNLLWLPEREGVRRVGIIDFQDALRGSSAYDLVSLCQDARRDVGEALEAALLAHYCERTRKQDPAFDETRFRTAYAILGAQRNTKILGIFARLSARDGKHGYLSHIPRVSVYLERNLAHEALGALRGWFRQHLPAESRPRLSSAA